jgi:hypothetical protein
MLELFIVSDQRLKQVSGWALERRRVKDQDLIAALTQTNLMSN